MIEIGPNLMHVLEGVGAFAGVGMMMFWMYKMVELSGK